MSSTASGRWPTQPGTQGLTQAIYRRSDEPFKQQKKFYEDTLAKTRQEITDLDDQIEHTAESTLHGANATAYQRG